MIKNSSEWEIFPAWSPDGRSIVFQSVRDGNFEVYRVQRDGSDPLRLTHDPAWDGWALFVSPHSRK